MSLDQAQRMQELYEALKPFGRLRIHPDAPDDGMVVVTNVSGGIIDTGPDARVFVRDIRRANKPDLTPHSKY